MRNMKLAPAAIILFATSITSASAGILIPMPVAGIGGPVALLAAIGAAGAYKFYRNRKK